MAQNADSHSDIASAIRRAQDAIRTAAEVGVTSLVNFHTLASVDSRGEKNISNPCCRLSPCLFKYRWYWCLLSSTCVCTYVSHDHGDRGEIECQSCRVRTTACGGKAEISVTREAWQNCRNELGSCGFQPIQVNT